MGDVSRQNIAGRHGEFNNALFFWSRMSTRENEAFVSLRSNVKTARLIVVLMALVLSGCGGVNNSNVADVASTQVPMRIVTDDLGRAVTVPVKITRVVSLAPSLTENIFAVGAGDRLVGVTTFCNYPEAAKSIAKIGDTMNPNMESIVALKPDVVFVSTASQIEAFTKTLDTNGIAVYVTNPTSLEGVFEDLEKIGDLFGTQNETRKVVDDLQERLKLVHCSDIRRCGAVSGDGSNPHTVRVFIQISNEPLFTIGKQSFVTEMLNSAGGESVTKDIETAYPKISKETALTLDPEAIILSDSDDNKEPNEVFKDSPAVKNGRVYRVNADLLSRPGPRLVDAIEQIARDLHPEEFRYR